MQPLPVAVVSFAAGLIIALAARGPVRGLGGDVLIVIFLVASAAALRWGSAGRRLMAVGALAVGLELVQLLRVVEPDAPRIVHVVLGSTFDPLDLAAYAVGLCIAAALERSWRPRVSSGATAPR